MKRRRRSSPRSRSSKAARLRLLFILSIALALLLLILLRESERERAPQVPLQEDATGIRVIDGDTFERSDGTRVRLLGIDTPEKGEPYYSEARDYLRSLLATGQLKYVNGPEPTDRYGRMLAFIYADSIFVNGELTRGGYARAYIFSDDILLTEPGQTICERQREAIAAHRRIWSLSPPRSESRYFGNAHSMKFHRPDCSSIRNSDTLELVKMNTRADFLNNCYSPCRNCDP